MKRKNLPNIFVLVLLFVAGKAMAQGQNSNFQWIGNPVTSVADETDEDQGTVYLYNMGTGKYLNTGSYWGTVVVGFNVGMTVTIKTSTIPGYYQMIGPLVTTEGKNIAFGRQMDTPGHDNLINYNRVYVDRGVSYTDPFTNTEHLNGILEWKFTETSNGSKTYYIHCTNDETRAGMGGEIYLTMASTGTGKTYDITYPHTENGAYSQWKIVTKADLKAAFKETYASDEKPADATFLVYDQNFERGNIHVGKWVPSGGLTGTYNNKFVFDPSKSGETYYVGNGAISSNYYMANYAGYTTANVRNIGHDNKANGAITQSVTTLKAGWYKVTCNGFYHADSNSGIVSKMFARVQGATEPQSNVETTLDLLSKSDQFAYTVSDMTHVYDGTDLDNHVISPYAKAGMLFAEGKYENSLLVYVPTAGNILNLGIEISGSTEDLDWTSWDNFQLQYCGNRDMVLDEAQTGLNYITQQVDANYANTLILKRTMKVGLWNSIMLPVSLTAAQVKTAFGDQTKLSKRPKQSTNIATRIDFTSVNLTNDADIAIEANTLYIIKPSKEPVGTGNAPYTKRLKDNTDISVTAPYYIINNVTLATDPAINYSDGIVKEESSTSTTIDGKLQFCGSLVNKSNKVVPAYSYVLGAKDGLWYYTQNANAIKGFRCWIATGSEAQAKALTFYIDGIEENTITGIDSIVANGDTSMAGNVYSINGQLVRSNTTSLEGLSKGIYIINGKKYIVK